MCNEIKKNYKYAEQEFLLCAYFLFTTEVHPLLGDHQVFQNTPFLTETLCAYFLSTYQYK